MTKEELSLVMRGVDYAGSIRQLSRHIGVDQVTPWKWLNGRVKQPRPYHLDALKKYIWRVENGKA